MGTNVKHVGGPWTAHRVMPNARLVTPTAEHYVTAGPYDWPGNRVVAAVHHVDGADAEHTAKLVAAAPDLLAALRGALRELVTPKGLPDVGKGRTTAQQAALDDARAAIAKATA